MACTPPIVKILLIPTRRAAYKIAGCSLPFLSGGEQRTICLQPAIFAGIPNIKIVENNGAVPPGIYNPTFSIPTNFRQHLIPGIVSITSTSVNCFS